RELSMFTIQPTLSFLVFLLLVCIASAREIKFPGKRAAGFLVDQPIEKRLTPDLSRINDPKNWHVINAVAETAVEDGKQVVRLKPRGKATTPSDIGLALVEGVEFAEGSLEIDL